MDKNRQKAQFGYVKGDGQHKHPRTDMLSDDLIKTFDKANALDHYDGAVGWKVSHRTRTVDDVDKTPYVNISLPEAMLRKMMSLLASRIKERRGDDAQKEFREVMYGRSKKLDYQLLVYMLVVLCYDQSDRVGLAEMAPSPTRAVEMLHLLSAGISEDDLDKINDLLTGLNLQQSEMNERQVTENEALKRENQQLRHQVNVLSDKLGDIAVELFSQNHANYSVLAGLSQWQSKMQSVMNERGYQLGTYQAPYILQDELSGKGKKVYRAQFEPKTEQYKETGSFESHRKMKQLGKIDYDKINKKYTSDKHKPKVDF